MIWEEEEKNKFLTQNSGQVWILSFCKTRVLEFSPKPLGYLGKEFTFWNIATYPQPGMYQECGDAAWGYLAVSKEKDLEEQGEAPPQGRSWRFGQHWGLDREDVCEGQ